MNVDLNLLAAAANEMDRLMGGLDILVETLNTLYWGMRNTNSFENRIEVEQGAFEGKALADEAFRLVQVHGSICKAFEEGSDSSKVLKKVKGHITALKMFNERLERFGMEYGPCEGTIH